MSIVIEVRKELEELAEEKYQKFQSGLLPGVDNLIGVRMPKLNKIAKKVAKDKPLEYLDNAEDVYYEETMLQGLVICEMKYDLDVLVERIETFIPKINNWSVCDIFCNHLKIVKTNKGFFWDFMQKYYKSDKPFYIRFALVIMINYYIDDIYLEKLFKIFDSICSDEYYVKMAVAWAVSMCFVKYPNETMKYLKNNKLDDETFNKSLSKIRDSLKVDKDTKKKILSMKR